MGGGLSRRSAPLPARGDRGDRAARGARGAARLRRGRRAPPRGPRRLLPIRHWGAHAIQLPRRRVPAHGASPDAVAAAAPGRHDPAHVSAPSARAFQASGGGRYQGDRGGRSLLLGCPRHPPALTAHCARRIPARVASARTGHVRESGGLLPGVQLLGVRPAAAAHAARIAHARARRDGRGWRHGQAVPSATGRRRRADRRRRRQ
mmetsp:Transcript_13346/g.39313  ORF Transcript_13346/g.39313 Transcript_13346/m.39313 type:complete len:205 (+) Transcript_13346:341-955(+)